LAITEKLELKKLNIFLTKCKPLYMAKLKQQKQNNMNRLATIYLLKKSKIMKNLMLYNQKVIYQNLKNYGKERFLQKSKKHK
jgi:hypothetical protein